MTLPEHIRPYAADFTWDNEHLWSQNVPATAMNVDELAWHFDIPWWHTYSDQGEKIQRFTTSPADIMNDPVKHAQEYERVMRADLTYPLDVIFLKNRWLILDGLHRLTKAHQADLKSVMVRIFTEEQCVK